MSEPVITAELFVAGMAHIEATAVTEACRAARHAPVFIHGRDGRIIGAIITEEQARDVAWREIVALGQELQGDRIEESNSL